MTTGAKKYPRWPEEQEQELRRLWQEGYSAGAIGVMMKKTRNSIIGKVHRLGLEPRASRVRKPVSAAKKAGGKRQATNFNFSMRAKKARPLPPTFVPSVADIVPLNGNGITLLELRSSQCHAVVKEHSRRSNELARYCGQPAWADTAYCEGHYAAFHQPIRPR